MVVADIDSDTIKTTLHGKGETYDHGTNGRSLDRDEICLGTLRGQGRAGDPGFDPRFSERRLAGIAAFL
jgi:hypothetical protein